MSEDRVEGADAPGDTPAVARAQVGRASVTGGTAGDLGGLGVLPSRQPAEGRTYRAGDYGTPADGPAPTLKPAEGSITPAPVLSFTTPPPENPDPAEAAGDRPAGAEPSAGGASAWSNFAMPKRETADASLNAAVATAQSEPAPIAEPSPAVASSPAALAPETAAAAPVVPAPISAGAGSAAYGGPAMSTSTPAAPAAPPLGVQSAAWPSSLAFGGAEPEPASSAPISSPPTSSSPVSSAAVSSAPVSSASASPVFGSASVSAPPFGGAPVSSLAPSAFGDAPVSAPPVSSAPPAFGSSSDPGSGAPASAPPVSSAPPAFGDSSSAFGVPVSAPPVSSAPPASVTPVSSGASVSAPPVTSGPPAFRAASPTSYGRPAATPAAVQPDYTLPDSTPAAVQPDYSLPAQRSGATAPAEPTRARASVPGLNRITPGAGGVVGSASSGTGYPRVYRAGAPGATEPDPIEPPEPAEPPAPPEPPQPAEPPAPGPGPAPTPFPDPNRPGPAPGPQPGPPVPTPPAPPAPPPGPPFPSPSPVPPFPPPPAGGTTWSSASAAGTPGRAGVPAAALPPWPASEVAQPGRQWPPRDESPVTPVVRGLSPDSADDPHGVAASAEYHQWARGQRRESGTVYSPPARSGEPVSRGVPVNPAIENTGSLTGHILSPQRWNDNSDSGNSTRVMVILASVAIAIIVVGIIASIVVGDQLRDLFGQ